MRGSQMQKAPNPDELSQGDKFRDLAGELECEENEAAFNERLKRLAKVHREATKPVKPVPGD
jgi:hypothetical protein